MIARLGLAISRVFRALMPDPFVLAVLLTMLVGALALALTPSSPGELVAAWASDAGLWSLLRFAMQMALILVTGHAIASSPPVARLLQRVASLPRSGAGAAALVAALATATGVLNWGLGLIVGAVAAREVGIAMQRKGVRAHYPLLAACGYLGMMVWHGGFSGSAPLKVTLLSEMRDIFGATPPIAPIPLDRTLLGGMNLFVTGGLLVILPVLMAMLAPRDAADITPASAFAVDAEPVAAPDDDPGKPRLPRLLEDSPLVSWALVALIAAWAWRYYFPAEGPSGLLQLTPDTVNLTMLMVGLLLHRTPASYVRAVDRAASGAAGIILQFPLYGGIMGIMAASGLTARFALAFAGTGSPTLLPFLSFLAASLINLFVPSGGGQWAVQGPIALQSAVSSGVDPAAMVMAVAYGDQLTNMLQPFWALPLLAITRVRARDIVGYTVVAMVVGGAWMAVGLLLFAGR